MARFRHRVTVIPIPRRWFESSVRTLHALAESLRAGPDGALRLPDGRAVPELRLARGEHLRPGARYEAREEAREQAQEEDGSPLALLVEEWRSDLATAVRLDLRSPDGAAATATARLASARSPGTVEADGRLTAPGRESSLRRGSGELRADLAAWWRAADRRRGTGRGGPAPLTGTLDHRLARARFQITPRRAPSGRWELTCTVTVRGRSWARPLVALGLLVARVRVRRELASALERAAADWNSAVPGLLRKDAAQLRAELTELLLRDPPSKDGAPEDTAPEDTAPEDTA